MNKLNLVLSVAAIVLIMAAFFLLRDMVVNSDPCDGWRRPIAINGEICHKDLLPQLFP